MFTEKDYNKIKEHFKTIDPKIYQLFEKHGYLQPTPKRNLFSILIGVVIGQRIRFQTARNQRGKLYTKLGKDNFLPEDILLLGESGLKEVGIESYKRPIILSLAKHIQTNPITPTTLPSLKSLKGIGDWTINCTLLMYSLNESENDFLDYLLTEDLIIRRGINHLYSTKDPIQVDQIQQKWKPYRGIVTWYLWKEYS